MKKLFGIYIVLQMVHSEILSLAVLVILTFYAAYKFLLAVEGHGEF